MKSRLIGGMAALLLLFLIGGCSSSSNDDDGAVPIMNEVPEFTALSIVNGFYRSAETLSFPSDLPGRKYIYELDDDQKTISRYTERTSGEIQYDVIYDYNETGLITTNRNVDAAGVASQTFNNTYDNQNRIVSSRSFNGTTPFLSTEYEFAASGAVSRKVVTNTSSGGAFSQTDYIYDNNGQLLSSNLTSPLLTTSIARSYTFTSVGNLLESVIDDRGDYRQLQYDTNGNVTIEESYSSDGRLLNTTTFEYTATDLVVPNLTLFRLTYEFDQY